MIPMTHLQHNKTAHALVGAVKALVGMHVPGKDGVHAILEQHLLHRLQHVIHLVLMRLVAIVPAPPRKVEDRDIVCTNIMMLQS